MVLVHAGISHRPVNVKVAELARGGLGTILQNHRVVAQLRPVAARQRKPLFLSTVYPHPEAVPPGQKTVGLQQVNLRVAEKVAKFERIQLYLCRFTVAEAAAGHRLDAGDGEGQKKQNAQDYQQDNACFKNFFLCHFLTPRLPIPFRHHNPKTSRNSGRPPGSSVWQRWPQHHN